MSRVLIPILLAGLAATPRHHSHSRTAFGDVTIAEGEEVRSAVAIGGNVTLLEGARAYEVMALGGSVELGKDVQVEKDVTAVGGDISVSPGARIGRNATTFGGAIEVDQGGSVAGTISPHPGYNVGDTTDEEDEKTSPVVPGVWMLLWGVFELFTLFAFGALILLVLPRQLDGIIESLSRHPWVCALTGLLGSLLLPPVILMLVVTLIGILFIPVLLVAVGVAGAVGYVALALFIGRLLRVPVGDYGKLALGVLIVTLVTFIPVVGTIAWFLGWLVVFGAVLRTRFGTRTTPRLGGNPPPVAVAAS